MARDRWLPLSARDDPSARQRSTSCTRGFPIGSSIQCSSGSRESCLPPLHSRICFQVFSCGREFARICRQNCARKYLQMVRSSSPAICALMWSTTSFSTGRFPLRNCQPWNAGLRTVARLGGDKSGLRAASRRNTAECRRVGVEHRVETETRPAQHLRDAWQKAWGRSPDASAAYTNAVRAVEAAYAPIVSPKNGQATLGSIIGYQEQALEVRGQAPRDHPVRTSID